MAAPQIVSYSITAARILNGKYLSVENSPFNSFPGLIGANSSIEGPGYRIDKNRYTSNLFEFYGCRFPSIESKEPKSGNVARYIASLLDGHIIKVIPSEAGVSDYKEQKEVTVQYSIVKGDIIIDENTTINETDLRYYPIRAGAVPGMYYIHGSGPSKKVYIIKRTTPRQTSREDPGTNETIIEFIDRFSVIEDITSDIPGELLASVTNKSISYTGPEAADGPEFSDNRINAILNTEQTITAIFKYEITGRVQAAFVFVGDVNIDNIGDSTDVQVAFEVALQDSDNCINTKILTDGYAYFTNNSYYLPQGVTSDADTKEYNSVANTYFFTNVPDLINENDVYDGKKGIFASDYWIHKRHEIIRYPGTLSYSRIKLYHVCPYRYWYLKLHIPNIRYQEDKVDRLIGVAGGGMLAAYRGLIIHYNAENILTARIAKGESLNEGELEIHIKRAQNHMLGHGVEEVEEYTFTYNDLQQSRKLNKNPHQIFEDMKLVKEALTNINSREYINDYDIMATEYPLSDTFTTVNGNKIRAAGSVDGVFYNSTNHNFAIIDIKSNKAYSDSELKQFYHVGAKYDFRILQVVWYWKFLLSISPIKINGNIVDIPDIVNLDKLTLGYDLVRYSDASKGIITIDNTKISTYLADIDAVIQDIVTNTASVAADANIPAHRIYEPKHVPASQGNQCKWCTVRSVCPTVKGNADAMQRRQLQNNRRLSSISVTGVERVNAGTISDVMDVSVEGNEGLYAQMGLGLLEYLPTQDEESKAKLLQRASLIRSIDKTATTQIGAVYITAPVTNIVAIDEKRHIQHNTLRTAAPLIFRVEGSSKIVAITIRFPDAITINNEMRHIIAQYRVFPYVSVRNSSISRTFMPFETNKDVYYTYDSKMAKLVEEYFNLKRGDGPDRPTRAKRTSAAIKQEMYDRIRFFYVIRNMTLGPVPDQVDTMDVVMELQLCDIEAISPTNSIKYLTDSHAVASQLAWAHSTTANIMKNSLYKHIQELHYETDENSIRNSLAGSTNNINSISMTDTGKGIKQYMNKYIDNLHIWYSSRKGYFSGSIRDSDSRSILKPTARTPALKFKTNDGRSRVQEYKMSTVFYRVMGAIRNTLFWHTSIGIDSNRKGFAPRIAGQNVGYTSISKQIGLFKHIYLRKARDINSYIVMNRLIKYVHEYIGGYGYRSKEGTREIREKYSSDLQDAFKSSDHTIEVYYRHSKRDINFDVPIMNMLVIIDRGRGSTGGRIDQKFPHNDPYFFNPIYEVYKSSKKEMDLEIQRHTREGIGTIKTHPSFFLRGTELIEATTTSAGGKQNSFILPGHSYIHGDGTAIMMRGWYTGHMYSHRYFPYTAPKIPNGIVITTKSGDINYIRGSFESTSLLTREQFKTNRADVGLDVHHPAVYNDSLARKGKDTMPYTLNVKRINSGRDDIILTIIDIEHVQEGYTDTLYIPTMNGKYEMEEKPVSNEAAWKNVLVNYDYNTEKVVIKNYTKYRYIVATIVDERPNLGETRFISFPVIHTGRADWKFGDGTPKKFLVYYEYVTDKFRGSTDVKAPGILKLKEKMKFFIGENGDMQKTQLQTVLIDSGEKELGETKWAIKANG